MSGKRFLHCRRNFYVAVVSGLPNYLLQHTVKIPSNFDANSYVKITVAVGVKIASYLYCVL